MATVYPNPWDSYDAEGGDISLIFDAPLRLRVDMPYVNGGGTDDLWAEGASTVLRCELPTFIKGDSTPTWLWYYRRESSDRENWSGWERFLTFTPTIDGSVEYDEWDVFQLGYNTKTGLREARLRVVPPETRDHYYQYCVAIAGPPTNNAVYGVSGSEYTLSENCLRYGHVEFGPYIDDPLVPRETPIKAAHMLEMQERTNILRDFYKLPLAEFSPIVAELTPLALWKQHVEEIRAALDEITPEPVAWMDVPVNQPRADVMEQIREVIMSL